MSTPTPEVQSRPRPVRRAVEVVRIEKLSPYMRRITVAGEAMEGFEREGAAGHVRLFFPAPGTNKLPESLDEVGPTGERPFSRVYTPRRWDPTTNELDLEFVLHAEGPATKWASEAKPGDVLLVAGPRGTFQPDPAADWYLIAGDEAGLPAIETIFELLPASAKVFAFVEVRDASAEIPLDSAAQVQLTWLHQDGAPAGQKLEEAVQASELPEGNGATFIACEAKAVRAIRRHLMQDRGIGGHSLHTRGYWALSESNHPDHDMGID